MDTNTTTINGKPVPSPAKEVMEDLAAERDELARRLAAIKSQLGTGGAAEARRALARVLTSVMSEKNLDAVFVCGELATAMDYLEVAEAAEDYAAELFDALDGLPPSDRVERARALLAASTHALDALVKRDNRPPCPVIQLRTKPARKRAVDLATVAPAKVPEPPPPGPGRGKKSGLAQANSVSRADDVRDAQLRAIAERAPEPARELFRG